MHWKNTIRDSDQRESGYYSSPLIRLPPTRLFRICILGFRYTGSRNRRAYSRVFLALLLLTLEPCKAIAAERVAAIGPLDQWVASDHVALLAA